MLLVEVTYMYLLVSLVVYLSISIRTRLGLRVWLLHDNH